MLVKLPPINSFYFIHFHSSPRLKLSKVCHVKRICGIFLLILATIDAGFWIFRNDSNPIDLIEPMARFLTFVLIISMTPAKATAPTQFVRNLPFLYNFKN
jgi:hypothetical protein